MYFFIYLFFSKLIFLFFFVDFFEKQIKIVSSAHT